VPAVVVDASALIEAVLNRPPGEAVHAAIDDAEPQAPSHLDAEILSTLFGHLRGGLIDEDRAILAMHRLATLPIERVAAASLLREALPLRANLSAYDALYVALARRLGCALITADRRLAAAPGLGIALTLVDAN